MTERRRMRKICNRLLAAAAALVLWGLMVTAVFRLAVYRTELLNESVFSTDFLEQRYAAFEEEVQAELEAAGLPAGLLERDELHGRFLMEIKKEFWGNASEKKDEWLAELTERKIMDFLESEGISATKEAERGIAVLGQNLQSLENTYTAVPEMEAWRERQNGFWENGRKTGWMLAGILLLILGTAAAIQHRKSRILDVLGIGGLSASVLTAVWVLTALWPGREETVGAAGLFWAAAAEIGLFLAAGGAAVSMCLWMFGKLCRGVRR